MKNKNLQSGFAPFLIIAIVAILAIGGGTYVSVKNKEAKKAQLEDNLQTQANANADANANANANLGANANAKGSLRSLLAMGKNTMCTFSSTAGGVSSSGIVYISADGEMRGDFTSNTSAGTQTSSMIVKGETSYVWSGTQGMKMNIKGNTSANASANANMKSNVGLDSEGGYKCENWSKDASKFVVPTSIKFLDVEAMLKGSANVDVNALMKLQGR